MLGGGGGRRPALRPGGDHPPALIGGVATLLYLGEEVASQDIKGHYKDHKDFIRMRQGSYDEIKKIL